VDSSVSTQVGRVLEDDWLRLKRLALLLLRPAEEVEALETPVDFSGIEENETAGGVSVFEAKGLL
jgi:hypothetical protein